MEDIKCRPFSETKALVYCVKRTAECLVCSMSASLQLSLLLTVVLAAEALAAETIDILRKDL